MNHRNVDAINVIAYGLLVLVLAVVSLVSINAAGIIALFFSFYLVKETYRFALVAIRAIRFSKKIAVACAVAIISVFGILR